MTGFVIVAALLLVGALLFVLPPLLTRRAAEGSGVDGAAASTIVLREQIAEIDQALAAGTIDAAGHAAARAEIERRVLEDGRRAAAAGGPADAGHSARAALVVGVAISALAVVIYAYLGTPAGIDPVAPPAASPEHALNREQVQSMVDRLATRLQTQPNDVDGWIMLARSLTTLRQYPQAVEAYARATAIRADDPQLLADFADTLAMARGRRIAGEPEALAMRALAIDPRYPKALALAGSAAFERGDYGTAISRWQTLLGVVPEGSDMARSVQGSIADARRRSVLQAGTQASGTSQPAAATDAAGPASSTAIDGEVTLSPEIASAVSGSDTIFVIARPTDGGRVPVAVLKRPVGAWPLRFRLDDSASMNPAQPLSSAGKVVLLVRVSKSGTPGAQPGDLEGVSDPVAPGAGVVRVQVSRRVQ